MSPEVDLLFCLPDGTDFDVDIAASSRSFAEALAPSFLHDERFVS
ncbi:hypothetical protein [Halovenus aranensis]|nr:hypothetical protein [Halovenus aranensis]